MERLIEEVRKYPMLYDQTNEKYRNPEFKERVWKAIATELNTNGGGEECKKKWTSIRDQFRRTLQKRKTVSGQAAASSRKYKYEDLLQFLLPHVQERDTISNVEDIEELSDKEVPVVDTPEEEITKDYEEPESMQAYVQEEPEIQSQKTQEEGLSINSSVKKRKFNKPVLKRKMNHQPQPQESASSQLMSYILTEKKTETQSKKVPSGEAEKHPVDAFLAGIGPPLKSLNPILLNQAKGRIFSIVQEYEMKQLLMTPEETNRTIPTSQFVSSQAYTQSPASSGSIFSVPTPYVSPNSPVYYNLDNTSQHSQLYTTNQTQNYVNSDFTN